MMILVVGTGNPLLRDDGVGPRAIEELGRSYEMPEGVRLLDGGTAGLGLVAELSEADRILILDAVRTRRFAPGTVVTFEGARLADAPRGLFPHEVGLSDIVGTLRLMGRSPEVVVIGIEAESVDPGLELSAVVAASFNRLIRAAVRQLRRWGAVLRRRASEGPAGTGGYRLPGMWCGGSAAVAGDLEVSGTSDS